MKVVQAVSYDCLGGPGGLLFEFSVCEKPGSPLVHEALELCQRRIGEVVFETGVLAAILVCSPYGGEHVSDDGP